jgi:hypothetical protein
MGYVEPQSERVVVWASEESVGLALHGAELPCDICEVSGHILHGVPVVSWPGLGVLAHDVRIRAFSVFTR